MALAAMTLDLTDPAAIGLASHNATANLVSLYTAEAAASTTLYGGFSPTAPSSVAWWSSGLMWGSVFRNSYVTGDRSLDVTAGTAMGIASFAGTGDFLGGSTESFLATLRGIWNDDIAWWALAAMAAVDAYGANATMPGGVKFLTVAELTFNEVYSYWDTSCGGGIFWARDKTSTSATYKSTITNSEFVQLGARLAVATGNATYANLAATTYAWMKTVGVVTSDWQVLDGVHSTACTVIDPLRLSYETGVLLGGLGYMYKATGDAIYLTDASSILASALPYFAPAGVITEPTCPTGNNTCSVDYPMFKPQLVRGLGMLWSTTNDSTTKTQISTVLDSTLTSALKNCDASWWCSQEWLATLAPTKTAYDQYAITELLVAVGTVHGATAPAADSSVAGLTTAVGASGTTGSSIATSTPSTDNVLHSSARVSRGSSGESTVLALASAVVGTFLLI
ncbi:hydrolase 76 protein [Thoreauomyces humboldtii]|nr:hydrolase 76 protein [Thoreauomyces humboldtii]